MVSVNVMALLPVLSTVASLDADNTSSFQVSQHFQDVRNQRLQVLNPIRSCCKHYHCYILAGQVLLIRDSLVSRDERVELVSCQRKQFTAAFAFPSPISCRLNIMSAE
jgi:hypothetical protein